MCSVAQESLGLPLLSAINIANPQVFIGLLIGGALPFLFSALTIRAVARAASQIVNEVRRQLRIPGMMEGTVQPDYARAVAHLHHGGAARAAVAGHYLGACRRSWSASCSASRRWAAFWPARS